MQSSHYIEITFLGKNHALVAETAINSNLLLSESIQEYTHYSVKNKTTVCIDTNSALTEDEIKELRRTTRFYPRTADLPMEIKNKVLLSHILEFNKLETNEINYVNSLIIEELDITTYHEGFKEFIRFVVMDFWNSLGEIFSQSEKLAELKKDITSQEVLDVIDDMNKHYLSRGG